MNPEIFFNGWDKVLRVVVLAAILYPAIVLILRSSGKRPLSKMSGFDLVVMAALGATFSTTILSDKVSLAQGLTLYVMLFLFQFLLSWLSARSKAVHKFVKHSPTLLYRNGEMLQEHLKGQRITEEEVRAAVRSQGYAAMEDVQAVILEGDGNLSVIAKSGAGLNAHTSAGSTSSALTHDIEGLPEHA